MKGQVIFYVKIFDGENSSKNLFRVFNIVKGVWMV